MKKINVEVVPLLPMKDIINGEAVAFGIIDAGVLVHYLEKDIARIIEWEDIIGLGLGLTSAIEPANTETKEIAAPEKPK